MSHVIFHFSSISREEIRQEHYETVEERRRNHQNASGCECTSVLDSMMPRMIIHVLPNVFTLRRWEMSPRALSMPFKTRTLLARSLSVWGLMPISYLSWWTTCSESSVLPHTSALLSTQPSCEFRWLLKSSLRFAPSAVGWSLFMMLQWIISGPRCSILARLQICLLWHGRDWRG